MKLIFCRLPYQMKNMLHHFDVSDKDKFLVITDDTYKNEYEKMGVPVVSVKDYENNPDAIIKALQLHELHDFKKILALEEVDVDKACIVSEMLNLKHLNIVDGKNYRNKYLMKKMLPKNPLFKIPAIQKATDDISDLTYPCVLKKDALYAAKDVFFIKDKAELIDIMQSIDANKYVIEEYVDIKKMISVDGYLFNGVIQCLYVHEYSQNILSYMNDDTLPLFVTSTSALNDSEEAYDQLSQMILFITKTLNYGTVNEMLPFHLELFYDVENEEYTFCEIGKRFGGGKITELVDWAFHRDMTKDMYEFEVRGVEPNKDKFNHVHKYAAAIRIPTRAGTLTNIPKFENYEFVVSTEYRHKVKDVIHSMDASNSCIGTVCIVADSKRQLNEYIAIIDQAYRENVTFEQ